MFFVFPGFGRHVFGEGLRVPFKGRPVSRDSKKVDENAAETISEGSLDQINF